MDDRHRKKMWSPVRRPVYLPSASTLLPVHDGASQVNNTKKSCRKNCRRNLPCGEKNGFMRRASTHLSLPGPRLWRELFFFFWQRARARCQNGRTYNVDEAFFCRVTTTKGELAAPTSRGMPTLFLAFVCLDDNQPRRSAYKSSHFSPKKGVGIPLTLSSVP